MISTCSSFDFTGSGYEVVLSLAGCTRAKARPIGCRSVTRGVVCDRLYNTEFAGAAWMLNNCYETSLWNVGSNDAIKLLASRGKGDVLSLHEQAIPVLHVITVSLHHKRHLVEISMETSPSTSAGFLRMGGHETLSTERECYATSLQQTSPQCW